MKKNLLFAASVPRIFLSALRLSKSILFLLLLTMFSSVAFAKIRYVMMNGAWNASGNSWGEASGDLQAMIDASESGDQLWVGRGTYEMGNGTVRMKSDLRMYGGFWGTESDPGERDLAKPINRSTIRNNGELVVFTITDDRNSLVDGFTFTGGIKNGGVTLNRSSVTLANCIISGNSAYHYGGGGGVLNAGGSTLRLINCEISNNSAVTGGGIYNGSGNYIGLFNCTISGNWSNRNQNSSAIYSDGSLAIRNTIIYGNDGVALGGSYANTGDVQFSLIQGRSSTANGNIDGNVNPLFVNPIAPNETPSMEDSDYHLQRCSPVRNVGSNKIYEAMQLETGFTFPKDLGRLPRRVNSLIDMGAYEEQTVNGPNLSGRIYVKAGAGGTGESWDCAMGDLQDAINIAVSGRQIWVADGIYVPKRPANGVTGDYMPENRDNAFVLKGGVKIYGGFDGTELHLDDRLFGTDNASILSGDLNGDDNYSRYSDNAYHVVVLAGDSAYIDGFTISGGNADGEGSLNITGQTSGLLVERAKGGGVWVYSNTASTFNNLIIAGNNAKEGGGISLRSTKAMNILGSVITGNTASVEGGGMYIDAIAPVLTNLTISGNVAPRGGGIALEFVGAFDTFGNSVVHGNSGGSVYLGKQSSGFKPQYSLVQDVTDSSDHNIPGDTDPMFTDPLSPGLSTKGDYSLQMCSPLINTGNFWVYNGTFDDVAGNDRIFGDNIEIGAYELNEENILAGKGFLTADDASCYDNSVALTFTSTQGGNGPFSLMINGEYHDDVYSGVPFPSKEYLYETTTFTMTSVDRINSCPPTSEFVESSVTVKVGSFQASLLGSAVCSGENGWLTLNATDSKDTLTAIINGITYTNLLSGKPFEVGNTIGEYTLSSVTWANGCERYEGFTQASASVVIRDPIVHYVKQGGTGDGLSWESASGDLQAILNGVCLSDTVFVAAGTYQPTGLPDFVSTTDPRDFTFLLINGVRLYGGFAGTETNISQRVRGNVTILSGNIDNNDDLGDDSYHVVLSVGDNSNAVFDGFTVTGGNAYGEGSLPVGTLSVSRNDGGGMSVIGNAPKISNVNFNSNIARRGGGLSVEAGNASISNANFTNNKTYGDVGGGVFLDDGSNSVFTNCVFADNVAGGSGGGISSYAATLTLRNCIVRNNLAEEGGGMFMLLSTADVINSTITANNNFKAIGGVYALNTAFRARNSIFWRNNTEEIVVEIEPGASGVDEVRYSLVDGGYASGENIVNADPGFVNAASPAGPDGIWRTADDGLRIYCDGPAAESGSGETPELDILGIKRANQPDMGAYEAFVRNLTGTDASLIIDQQPNTVVVYADCVNQIATIDGGGSYNVSGEVMAKVWVDANQPVQYVKRHYQITPAENRETATAKLTLYFTQQDFTDFNNQSPAPSIKLPVDAEDVDNNKAHLRVEKRDGTGDENGSPGSYSGTLLTINPSDYNGKVEWNPVASRWEVSFEVTGFSGFFIKTTPDALPLRLISFTARKSEENNLLQWSTASEVNTDNFEVQSSMDAKNFNRITIINAAGSGNHQYTYSDAVLGDGRVYYRLKMNDLDGTFAYSRIISLASESSGAAVVYPNPAGNMIYVRVGNALLKSSAILYDITGRLIQRVLINANQQPINIKSLTSGLYFLKFADGTAERFVKE